METNPAKQVGVVYLVGAGPGDPGLLTVRGQRLLEQADVVVYDALSDPRLLAHCPRAERIYVGKRAASHSFTQDQINGLLVEKGLAGKRVVRLKGGDPFVFGRGFEEAQACADAGVELRVIPGITSAVSVPGLGGIPVTHRGVAHEFTVVSGHVPPGDPRSLVHWDALGKLRGTLVLLMAVDNLPEITRALVEAGRDPLTPAAVVQDGSLASQRAVYSTVSQLADEAAGQGLRPPAIVVIGEVVGIAQALATRAPVPA